MVSGITNVPARSFHAEVNNVHFISQDHPNRINQLVVLGDDRSTIKGLLWAYGTFQFGSMTLGSLFYTALTSPLIVTPLAVIPVGLGITSYILGSITGGCLDNALFHLGSRQVRVIQVG